jgi:outer membrane cobalamin receptor
MRALTLSLLVVAVSCARTTRNPTAHVPPGALLITQQQIERSGGHTAWEVLKRTAPMLTFRESRTGRPSSLGRRGPSSITLDDPPLIVLDGVRESDFRVLDNIPASTILSIYILTGIEGTTYYGTDAVSGVIVIRTKDGT